MCHHICEWTLANSSVQTLTFNMEFQICGNAITAKEANSKSSDKVPDLTDLTCSESLDEDSDILQEMGDSYNPESSELDKSLSETDTVSDNEPPKKRKKSLYMT